MMKIDLHLHSTLSDGSLDPEEVVQHALNNGCAKIAITDHEFASDFSYIEDRYPIEITPGIEFNSAIRNLHMLGYGMTDIDGLNDALQSLKEKNSKVCYEVIRLMAQDGYDVSVSKIVEYVESLGINCDILDKRKLVKYLIYQGYASSIVEAYGELIGVGRRYYVPNFKLNPPEIIGMIKEANGLAVLAHPNTLNVSYAELRSVIYQLRACGLDGIEIINSKMTKADIAEFKKIATEFGILQTAGSDFHSIGSQKIGVEVEDEIYKEFRKQILKRTKL